MKHSADMYRITNLDNSSVFNVYLDREFLLFDPPYQRSGDIWTLEKRQVLVDSILNGFDIPKFYFHQFYPSKRIQGKEYKYAIIDGKQRLKALWDFMDGKFGLRDDFELLSDLSVRAGGMTYDQLAKNYPRLKATFDSKLLTIVCIQTDDTELIEEMFSRLNEASPLNAAEKRNALPGPLPTHIRQLAVHEFFAKKLPFSNRRYRHFDLACKLLYLEDQGKIVPTYKIDLDEFVKQSKDMTLGHAKKLAAKCGETLGEMCDEFNDGDDLLRSAGLDVVYYMIFRTTIRKKVGWSVSRGALSKFELARAENRERAEKKISKADFDLLEFDRLTQSPNDGPSLQFRYDAIVKWLKKQ